MSLEAMAIIAKSINRAKNNIPKNIPVARQEFEMKKISRLKKKSKFISVDIRLGLSLLRI